MRVFRSAGAAVALAATLAFPPAPAPAQAPEDCAKLRQNQRDYLDCLGNAQKDAERRLDRALAGVVAAIEATATVQPAQRRRWIGLIDEAQGRFVLWRNFECQSIAPYEGGSAAKSIGGRLGMGIGTMEQRFLCLIRLNSDRAGDLERRYPPPPGWSYSEPAPAPALEPARPSNAAPARIIEMPR